MGDGVLGELGERLVDPLALLVERRSELDDAEHAPAQDLLAADADDAARDRHRLAVAQQLEGVARRDVDQQHPGAGEQQRPGVRVAPVGGLRGVDHRPHAGRDQLLGRDPVDVEVVDDRDVAGTQPLDQVLGAAPEPGGALDRPVRRTPRCAARAAQGSDGDWRWPRSAG